MHLSNESQPKLYSAGLTSRHGRNANSCAPWNCCSAACGRPSSSAAAPCCSAWWAAGPATQALAEHFEPATRLLLPGLSVLAAGLTACLGAESWFGSVLALDGRPKSCSCVWEMAHEQVARPASTTGRESTQTCTRDCGECKLLFWFEQLQDLSTTQAAGFSQDVTGGSKFCNNA